MQHFCSEVYEKSGKVDAFVATAGTPTTVAAMKLGLNYFEQGSDFLNFHSIKAKSHQTIRFMVMLTTKNIHLDVHFHFSLM